MVLTLIGAGLLWFGWFGFNGGSALHANAVAASALTASQVAAAAAVLGWLGVEWLHRGKPTALGLASGLVAGLVVITPASGFVEPWAALVMGLIGGVVCYGAVALKPRLGYDDSLDAFGVHGVGGFLGAVLTGVFASKALVKASFDLDPLPGNLPAGGAVFGGVERVGVQLVAAVMAAVWAFALSYGLIKGLDVLMGFTSESKAEGEGLDRTEHGEVGFDLGLALEAAPEKPLPAPRPATVPPNGKRHFTVIVEGAKPQELMHAWSEMCQAGVQPTSEFRDVYPYVTTVQGNRFHFRGGDPGKLRHSMQKLFQDRLDGTAIATHVED
jgi:Amt family ammonium transporter